jgi:hypothetical protein
MSVARELLDRLVELGATVKPAGGHSFCVPGQGRFLPSW